MQFTLVISIALRVGTGKNILCNKQKYKAITGPRELRVLRCICQGGHPISHVQASLICEHTHADFRAADEISASQDSDLPVGITRTNPTKWLQRDAVYIYT
jgi:hypothetical protein